MTNFNFSCILVGGKWNLCVYNVNKFFFLMGLFRLTGAERVDYAEKSLKRAQYVIIAPPEKEKRGSVRVTKSKKGREHSEDEEICIKENFSPEVYNEKHEQLLGDCNIAWTLDVDGYDEDGQRIYDHFEGKHCHQCRYSL